MERVNRFLTPWTVFPAAYIAFLVAGLISFLIPDVSEYFDNLPALSKESLILILFGLTGFVSSSLYIQKVVSFNKYIITGGLLLSLYFVVFVFTRDLWLSIIGTVFLFSILFSFIHIKKVERFATGVTVLAFLTGIIILFFLKAGLFAGELREDLVYNPLRPFFYTFAIIASALSPLVFPVRRAILLSGTLAAIALLGGFKVDFIVILLSFLLARSLRSGLSLKAWISGIGIILLVFILAAVFIAYSTYGVWNIPSYLYPFYRAGFTLLVFSGVAEISFPFGYLGGYGFLHPTEVDIITAKMVLDYAEPVLITSSFFGPFGMDFGLPGVLLAGLFTGGILGILYKNSYTLPGTAFYAAGLAHTLTLIELGFNSLSIPLYMVFLYISISRLTGAPGNNENRSSL